ncbi:hypothetical protein BD779DRAFT_991079 [Infundibulicybe gibba]|nr:hypothetical protein BD779DRAFT_991079 [Infundibulicybe gibba]
MVMLSRWRAGLLICSRHPEVRIIHEISLWSFLRGTRGRERILIEMWQYGFGAVYCAIGLLHGWSKTRRRHNKYTINESFISGDSAFNPSTDYGAAIEPSSLSRFQAYSLRSQLSSRSFPPELERSSTRCPFRHRMKLLGLSGRRKDPHLGSRTSGNSRSFESSTSGAKPQ